MEDQTAGTRVLLGDQRKGIIALAIPIGIAMFFQQLNNIVDSFWVAGLGSYPLAAIGLVFPIYLVLIGAGTGLGVGSSAAIARSIGKGNHRDANLAGSQSVVLTLIISVALTIVLVVTAVPCLEIIGAGDTIDECLDYAYPLYFGSFFVLMSGVLSGMLRGEGAAKKSMAIQIAGALVNIVLDPILIYGLDMGVSGAAIATLAAFVTSIVIATYWYVRGNDLYVRMRRQDFRPEPRIWREILSVGGPEAIELSIIYVFNLFSNLVIVMCGGTEAVAIFGTSWRIIGMILIVCQALAGALVAVCSAEFGMGRFDMIRDAFRYTVIMSVGWTIVLSLLLAIGAGPISSVFTYSEDLQGYHHEMVVLLLYMAVYLPVFTLVYTGSALQQALNKATGAMVNSILRNLLYAGGCWVAFIYFDRLDAIWMAILLTEVVGGLAMYVQAKYVLGRSEREYLAEKS